MLLQFSILSSCMHSEKRILFYYYPRMRQDNSDNSLKIKRCDYNTSSSKHWQSTCLILFKQFLQWLVTCTYLCTLCNNWNNKMYQSLDKTSYHGNADIFCCQSIQCYDLWKIFRVREGIHQPLRGSHY